MPLATISPKVTLDAVMQAMAEDNCTGFCLACGAERGLCEPDARNYKCDNCGEFQVFGAEEILIQFHPV